jgi:anaerobic selenocysteine-containing dehydrogenase
MLVREDTTASCAPRPGGRRRGRAVFHDPERVVPGPAELARGLTRLEGRFEATLANGKKVSVRPVFEVLREHLAAYTPHKAAAMSGTPASQIQDLARRLAKAKAASMVTTSNFAKYYHGNLIERTQALVFALTGNYGKKGSGFVVASRS